MFNISLLDNNIVIERNIYRFSCTMFVTNLHTIVVGFSGVLIRGIALRVVRNEPRKHDYYFHYDQIKVSPFSTVVSYQKSIESNQRQPPEDQPKLYEREKGAPPFAPYLHPTRGSQKIFYKHVSPRRIFSGVLGLRQEGVRVASC